MKRLSSLLTCVLLVSSPFVMLNTGCNANAPVTAHSDPIVANSERAIATAFDAIDAFLRWEHLNSAVVTPQVHAVAQDLRRKAPDAFRNARAVLRAYKENRTPEQKALLDTWLATISELARVATAYQSK